jgi:hypothetical protein
MSSYAVVVLLLSGRQRILSGRQRTRTLPGDHHGRDASSAGQAYMLVAGPSQPY